MWQVFYDGAVLQAFRSQAEAVLALLGVHASSAPERTQSQQVAKGAEDGHHPGGWQRLLFQYASVLHRRVLGA